MYISKESEHNSELLSFRWIKSNSWCAESKLETNCGIGVGWPAFAHPGYVAADF
jgi:hypothetical protein